MATLRGLVRRLAAVRAALMGRPYEWPNPEIGKLTPAFEPFAFREFEAPLVSILVPAYGQLAITTACLRSLATMRCGTTFEVLVLDDATPDGSLAVLGNVVGLRYMRSDVNRGFLRNVNWGATFARGEILLLLNNDTIVDPEFLDPLVETLLSAPDIGAVGSLLLYPSGVVQEAGGIIWSNGSGWNYGRHDQADDSRNLWRREVDYCSGACLAVRRSLWEQVGGFDERFQPAYYEDTDLCFSLRELGFRVIFEPRSRVVHLEGVSHGTDVAHGLKRHQAENQERFLTKWHHRMQEHYPPHPDFLFDARTRHRGPRIAIIDHVFPTPQHDSGSVRMSAVVEQLHALGALVHFLPLSMKAEGALLQRWQNMGIEVFYGNHDIGDTLRQLGRRLDAVVLSRPHVAAQLIVGLREAFPDLPLVYDMVDAHGLRQRRAAELAGDVSLRRTARTLHAMEVALCSAADLVIAVSPDEVSLMRSHAGAEVRFEVLPNIHRVFEMPRENDHRAGVLFVGGYRHTPNVDAAIWMAKAILPLLAPTVRLTLAGSGVVSEVAALANDRVDVPGWLEDLSPLYHASRVVVAPLRFGAGVKGKIGEAMAHGVPVVTTSIGAEGLRLTHGENALIADTEVEFAAAVSLLMHDDDLWRQLSAAGQEHVALNFGPDAAEQSLRRILDAVGVAVP